LDQTGTSIVRIFKNTSYLTIGEFTSRGLSFALTILIARFLGDTAFGQYSFAVAFCAIFIIIADFGLWNLTIREVARDRSLAERYLSNGLALKLILGFITYALIFIAISLIKQSRDIIIITCIMGVYTIVSNFTFFFTSVFRAYEQMKYEVVLKIIHSIVLFSLGLLVLIKGLGLSSLMIMFVATGMLDIILIVIVVRRRFTTFSLRIDLGFWKKLLKEAWPFALATTFALIYTRIDTVMLGAWKGYDVVGWYNAAYNIIFAIGAVPSLLAAAAYPALSSSYQEAKSQYWMMYRRLSKYLALLAILTVVVVFLLSKSIIVVLYGPDFSNAIIALQILVCAEAINFMNYLHGKMLESANRQRLLAYFLGVGAVINVILNAIFIPQYSYIGAAYTTMASYIVVFILCRYTIHRGI